MICARWRYAAISAKLYYMRYPDWGVWLCCCSSCDLDVIVSSVAHVTDSDLDRHDASRCELDFPRRVYAGTMIYSQDHHRECDRICCVRVCQLIHPCQAQDLDQRIQTLDSYDLIHDYLTSSGYDIIYHDSFLWSVWHEHHHRSHRQ